MKVRPEDIPTEYTAIKDYEDEHIYVAFGGGGLYDEQWKRVVVVEFVHLKLSLVAGELLYDNLKQTEDKSDWVHVAMQYLLAFYPGFYKLFERVAKNMYTQGLRDGRNGLQAEMRKALGLET